MAEVRAMFVSSMMWLSVCMSMGVGDFVEAKEMVKISELK
jgi:hypothetical protein